MDTVDTNRQALLRSLLLVALGLLAFAAGVLLARRWLPEWRSAPLSPQSVYTERFAELTRRAGASPAAGQPQVYPTLPGKGDSSRRRLDELGPDAAVAVGGGLLVEVRQKVKLPSVSPRPQELVIRFLPGGEPWSLNWGRASETIRTTISGQMKIPTVGKETLARLLLHPGETLAPAEKDPSGKDLTTLYRLQGSQPPQEIEVDPIPGGLFNVTRRLGQAGAKGGSSDVAETLLIVLPVVLGIVSSVALFLVLLGKRRIDLASGLRIAGVLFVIAAVSALAEDFSWIGALSVLGGLFLAACAFVFWSAGESLLRAASPGTLVSLDALRTGRLGPRGAEALLTGLAAGSALAGLGLAAVSAAAWSPAAWARNPSLQVPLFGANNPFYTGTILAAAAAIALGLAVRFLPARWAPWAAVAGIGLAVPFVSIRPAGWEIAVGLAAAGLLVLAGRRGGLAAILVATECACLLPVAAFAALHLSWFPFSFLASAAPPALCLALGLVGAGRPELAERERLRPPAFIRRLEDEKRLSHEMDLLARMQLGLLPSALPEIPGWEIAVRSLLATEAGGDLYDFLRDSEGSFWIAAGDVAGHGYSCAIVQAMTSAALTSIVAADRTPSEVLHEVDRVIRRGGSHRHFTSLALVRLDPATGKATMSNAGHPFPLLLAHRGEVEEISLPGLPLGQGPKRRYADLPLTVPPGGALIFCSDGLFEATDPHGAQYGYDRPRDLLRRLGDRPAAEILAALLADWRAYMRSDEAPADDTTVLVLKRL